VEADFAIELGAEDETLEMPWAAEDGSLRYCDLKRSPELLRDIQEAQQVLELEKFLLTINSENGHFETAKCDVWSSNEINPEEDIFEATTKFGGYIDLLFSKESSRFSFEQHEAAVRQLTKILQQSPELPASAECLVRRCYYHVEKEVEEGFYITFYLFGYGDDETEARQRWGDALKLALQAIQQLSEP
jgi:hypothetical protein